MRALAALILLTLSLAGCGGGGSFYGAAPPPKGEPKVGRPYQINGVWYHPKEDPYYDETGIASWYGRKFHGRRTANGDVYDMNKLTAAHPTLPMPSQVLVTNLENGRSIIVTVNDRGPFARGRLIDMSRRSAQLLGFEEKGVARVRVQAYPLRGGGRRVARYERVTTDSDTRWLVDKALASGSPSGTDLFVQAGAFSERMSAERLRNALAALGPAGVSRVRVNGESLYRVRIGPLASVGTADRMLNRVLALGYGTARIVVECKKQC